jgi:hypothetical protein
MVCKTIVKLPPSLRFVLGRGGFLLGAVMTSQVRYFRIKNFEHFQHYKNRRPTWIKFYNSLLTDLEFNALTEVQQLHLLKLWLLASQNKNKLIYDSSTIRKRLGLDSRLSLEVFVKAGFIEIIEGTEKNASTTLAFNKEVEKEKYKKPVAKKPTTVNYEIQDSTKAERAWLAEYERVLRLKPDRSPAKDRKIMKDLVDQHGLETILERIPRHISGEKLLSIGGFKIKFNDLVDSPSKPNAMKLPKPLQLSRDELQLQIQRQVEFVKEELAEGVDRDFVWFHRALGHYVVEFEDRYGADPLTGTDRAWFDRLRGETQELEAGDYPASREEEAARAERLMERL